MPAIATLPSSRPRHSLPADELRLRRIARRYIEDYPDARGTAYATALAILRKHSSRRLSPDKVYWHRFSNSVSSGSTFTGWKHTGTPVESMTLVELVMHRFSARDQDADDELQVYGGFYTDGPQHGTYDEHNEVAMLPQAVLRDFWAVDFSSAYRRRIKQFWTRHRENFRTLAKAHLLAAAGQARRNGGLQEDDYLKLIHAVAPALAPVMTLADLQARHAPRAGITWRSFDIGEYVAHDIVRLVDDSGAQILYVPGQAPSFHCFASEGEFKAWVLQRCADARSRTAFSLHFFASQMAKDQDGGGFDRWIGQLQRNEWSDQKVINRLDKVIHGDVFEHLGELALNNLQAQARQLTSNASLRKQMWLGYLNAFIRLLDAVAPLGWPVALTLVGAGLISVSLSIDQAINGTTPGLRKEGVLSAVFGSIFLAFNLPGLTGIRQLASAEDWVPAVEEEASLRPLRGNRILDVEPSASTLERMRGVYALSNGETWIRIGNLPYRVVFSETRGGWSIVDPLNPFAFQGARPVRLSASGEWELLAAPKLKGGSPMQEQAGPSGGGSGAQHQAPTHSSFWDVYMRFDLAEEERLSTVARERQRQFVDETIRECDFDQDSPGSSSSQQGADEYITTNDEGDKVLVDAWGDEYRVFKTRGEYFGGRVEDYVRDDVTFNTFLRTGQSQSPHQVRLIEQLAQDIDSIGYNNDVDLYRGGSGHRATSGVQFRSGQIRATDILINTDFTSFSENPYVARAFCSSQGGVQSHIFQSDMLTGSRITFDETAVVFELPRKSYTSATPIALFSGDWEEAESIFKPGNYFQIDDIGEVTGEHYRFIRVRLRQVYPDAAERANAASRIFDMRTGEPFDRQAYAARLGSQGAVLLERFFPL